MNLMRVERRLVVLTESVGVATYDFDFELHFACQHPHVFDDGEVCIARVEPIRDYAALSREMADVGLSLVN